MQSRSSGVMRPKKCASCRRQPGMVAGAALARSRSSTPQSHSTGVARGKERAPQRRWTGGIGTVLTPTAAAATPFSASNDPAPAGRNSVRLLRVRATRAGSTLAVVAARVPGGVGRRLTASVDEVETADGWLAGAPFTAWARSRCASSVAPSGAVPGAMPPVPVTEAFAWRVPSPPRLVERLRDRELGHPGATHVRRGQVASRDGPADEGSLGEVAANQRQPV